MLDRIKLPPGFAISLYTDNVPGARSLALGERGALFVGTRKGVVYAVRDEDGDGRAESVITVARRLDSPNGVAFRRGALYVAEISRVLRFDGIEGRLHNPPQPAVVNDTFPRDRHHGWKFIRFGPDDRLYVPVGAPCNVCLPKDERYATIMRMNPDGSGLEVYARGVRNTVGFVAEHGSWNRSTPIGYRISLVRLEADGSANYSIFAEGWSDGRRAWGRPVDLLIDAAGALIVSDDRAGALYRIHYQGD